MKNSNGYLWAYDLVVAWVPVATHQPGARPTVIGCHRMSALLVHGRKLLLALAQAFATQSALASAVESESQRSPAEEGEPPIWPCHDSLALIQSLCERCDSVRDLARYSRVSKAWKTVCDEWMWANCLQRAVSPCILGSDVAPLYTASMCKAFDSVQLVRRTRCNHAATFSGHYRSFPALPALSNMRDSTLLAGLELPGGKGLLLMRYRVHSRRSDDSYREQLSVYLRESDSSVLVTQLAAVMLNTAEPENAACLIDRKLLGDLCRHLMHESGLAPADVLCLLTFTALQRQLHADELGRWLRHLRHVAETQAETTSNGWPPRSIGDFTINGLSFRTAEHSHVFGACSAVEKLRTVCRIPTCETAQRARGERQLLALLGVEVPAQHLVDQRLASITGAIRSTSAPTDMCEGAAAAGSAGSGLSGRGRVANSGGTMGSTRGISSGISGDVRVRSGSAGIMLRRSSSGNDGDGGNPFGLHSNNNASVAPMHEDLLTPEFYSSRGSRGPASSSESSTRRLHNAAVTPDMAEYLWALAQRGHKPLLHGTPDRFMCSLGLLKALDNFLGDPPRVTDGGFVFLTGVRIGAG